MHITRQGIFALSLAGVFAMACSKKSESDGVADASATSSLSEVVVEGNVENVPVVPPIDVAVVAVEPRAFDPANYPGTTPRGEVLGGFSFVDSAGENFVIFSRETKERDELGHPTQETTTGCTSTTSAWTSDRARCAPRACGPGCRSSQRGRSVTSTGWATFRVISRTSSYPHRAS